MELYTAIQAHGVTDAAFHAGNLARCPTALIWRTYKALEERDRIQALFQNFATAQIASGLMGGSDVYQFIPMGDRLREESGTLSGDTARVIRELLKQKLLPPDVIAALSPVLEQVSKLAQP